MICFTSFAGAAGPFRAILRGGCWRDTSLPRGAGSSTETTERARDQTKERGKRTRQLHARVVSLSFSSQPCNRSGVREMTVPKGPPSAGGTLSTEPSKASLAGLALAHERSLRGE